MTFLPIVERELRVRARQGATYHGRWGVVLIALLFSLPFLLHSSPGTGRPDGKTLFAALTMLAFAYCLFGGARLTSDSVSSEKREGTLGLLFLTHLRGYDVVLGKLVANSLSSFYGLLAVLPVFGLALLAGGVTGGEFWRVALVLVNTLFFSLALGLWISARSQDEQKILAGTNLLLVAIAGGLPLLDLLFAHNGWTHHIFSLASPGFGCYLAFELNYRGLQIGFWYSLLVVHALGWIFLLLAGKAVIHYRQDELTTEQTARVSSQGEAFGVPPSIPAVARALAQRRALLSSNPVLWLAQRQPGQKTLIWSLTGLRLGLSLIVLLILIFLGRNQNRWGLIYWPQILSQLVILVFWYAVASVACRFFVQARRNGTLELLLSTPLSDRTILDGLWLHLRRLLTVPLLCILLAQVVTTLLTWGVVGQLKHMLALGVFVQILLSAVGLCVQMIAVCYVGLWLGLSLNKPNQAAGRAFGYVVLLPYVFCSGFPFYLLVPFGFLRGGLPGIIPWVGGGTPLLLILVNLGWIRWARGHLREAVRATALRHLTGESPPKRERQRPDPKTDLSESFSLLK